MSAGGDKFAARWKANEGDVERLNHWATEGEGVSRFNWGTDGDFYRCVAFMQAHGVPPEEIPGHCANLHKRATGAWPGHAPGESPGKRSKHG